MVGYKFSLQIRTRRIDMSPVVLKATITTEVELEEKEIEELMTLLEMQANGNVIDPEMTGKHTVRVHIFRDRSSD